MDLHEIRCAACRRKLGEGQYTLLRIKCPRCGTLNALVHSTEPATHPPRAPSPHTQHAAERPTQEGARADAAVPPIAEPVREPAGR